MGNKILLADDSITIQKVIELTFSDEDFEVVTVGNGRLAIEKVQEVRPDVLLCDVHMPEKDGYEVCDFVKKSPGLAQTPVLLLMGAFEPFDPERAARVGCDGFLAKPFEPETLIARVKELLAKAAAQKAASRPAPPPPPPEPAPAPVPPPPVAAPAAPFAPGPPWAPAFTAAPAPPPVASMPAPLPPVHTSETAFIPDEPFADLDAPTVLESPAPVAVGGEAVAAPVEEAIEELVPISPEESESLTGGPEGGAATVMFRADALPWTSPPAVAPAPPSPPAPAPAPAPPAPAPAFVSTAATVPATESVFEEVIEEDDGSSTLVMSTPDFPPPAVHRPEPLAPPPPPVAVPPARFEPLPAPIPTVTPVPPVAAPAPAFVAPPAFVPPPPPPAFVAPPAPPPPPVVEPPPPVVMAPPVPAPPAIVPPPPPPVHAPEPTPVPVVAPAPFAAPAEASFADLALPKEPEAPPAPPSVAAQVEVPVDMVSQIAQRVVAQVSEKMVERIAWEVIPDLAETLIKREIERLKAELQQLG